MKNKTKIKSVKKTTKSNVVKIPRKKNVSLDKKPDGTWNTSIDYYKSRDLERWLTVDDCLLIIPQLLKKRTWESWRSHNRESGSEVGPQYKIFGIKVYRIKVIWLIRYVKGLDWEQLPQSTATDSNRQHSSVTSNI